MLEKNKNDIWSKTRNKKPRMPTRTSGVLFENKSRISEVKDVECAEAAQTDDPPETLSAFSHTGVTAAASGESASALFVSWDLDCSEQRDKRAEEKPLPSTS